MRIVSGIYGGRKLQVPRGKDIRPTSDKVRGAMFNVLRGFDAVDGSRVLDAFCGSGALGLEALSQGAAHVTFCDKSRVSLDLAKENAGALGCAEHSDFILKDALKIDAEAGPYDLAFLDPPYGQNLIPKIVTTLHHSSTAITLPYSDPAAQHSQPAAILAAKPQTRCGAPAHPYATSQGPKAYDKETSAWPLPMANLCHPR